MGEGQRDSQAHSVPSMEPDMGPEMGALRGPAPGPQDHGDHDLSQTQEADMQPSESPRHPWMLFLS